MIDQIKKYLKRNKHSDRTKEYWEEAAAKTIEKVMEKICHNYDKNMFETSKDSLVFYVDMPLSSSDVVLDLACGLGRTCKFVALKVREYIGIDFIPKMIEKAKSYNTKYKNAKFYVNDGMTLNMFNDQTFDIIYCELTFQHMLKHVQNSYVNEVYRVLKNNGKFFAQLPKIEYYKDNSYALKKDEVENMLKNFSITYLNGNPAYYHIKAEKIMKS